MESIPDILLVYPPVMRQFPPTDPPFGLMYLGAALQKGGASVKILDLNALRWSDDQVKIYFKENHFPVVGIGGMSTTYYYIKWLTSYIKMNWPETSLIGGGSFATPCPELALRKTQLDAVCIGEGESVITPLLDRLINGRTLDDLEGIAYKTQDGHVFVTPPRERINDLDSLPFPAYDLIDMQHYLRIGSKRPSLIAAAKRKDIPLNSISNSFIMFSSRGCPFSCTFCYRNFGKQVTRHSVDYMIKHIKFLRSKFDINNIAFYDENFNVNRHWVMEFCKKIKEDLKDTYFWIGGARADLLDEELIKELKSALFYEISIGVESFDDRILKEMGKGIKAQKLFEILKLLKKYKIAPSYLAMLYGFPGDDQKSLHRSEEAIIRLGIPAYFQFPLPFPGTTLYQQLKRQGYVRDEEQYMIDISDHMTQELFINLSKFSDSYLIKITKDAESRILVRLHLKNKRFFSAFNHYMKWKYPKLHHFVFNSILGLFHSTTFFRREISP